MIAKVIKTEAEYDSAMARIEEIFDARPATPQGDELELLLMLVERYEDEAFPVDLPDPIAAIKFRMDQGGLKAKDVAKYFGGPSKVSEVLSGKRALSLTMIRNLVDGLGLPAEVMLQKPGAKLASNDMLEQAKKFPIAEMRKRGWFPGFEGTLPEAKNQLEDLLPKFLGTLGPDALVPSLNRQLVRSGCEKKDDFALNAWRIRVVTLGLREDLPNFVEGSVDADFLRGLARLSNFKDGPLLAKEYLNKNGIHFICERHLPKTHLDGAALLLPEGSPLVALTLRHDRLDNFWFTLFHELAHVALHLDGKEEITFFDDLDEKGTDSREKEADAKALESLIPKAEWSRARLSIRSSSEKVIEFARRLGISPAIPAGRIRHQSKNYQRFNELIPRGKLRDQLGV